MMKSPFILIENINNLTIYHSLDELFSSIEAIDVINNEYQAYDSEGFLLKIEIYSKKGQKENHHITNGAIKIKQDLNRINKKEELCQLLIRNLQNHQIDLNKTKQNKII